MPETYGAYGGRYVPETLIPALDEARGRLGGALADEAFAPSSTSWRSRTRDGRRR